MTRVFGDDAGAAIFLGAIVFFGLSWRVGFFITDNWTIANTLVAVADGHLYVDRLPFGLAGANTPGMHYVDGRLYGRNYGHVVLALPVLWVLEAASLVGDPRIVLAAAWSLAILAFGVQVARVADTSTPVFIGAGAAVLAFAGNVAAASPIDPGWFPVIALQAVTMLAAAGTGVLVYRVLRDLHGPATGTFAASVLVLASPIAFWATIPKRHVLTAFLAMVALYGLVAGRGSAGTGVRVRALGYVAVGVTAWIHAAEALALLAVFVPLDLAGEGTDRRTAAVLVAVLFLALVPFAATNVAISGDPLAPPRVLPAYVGQEPVYLDAGAPGGPTPTGPDATVPGEGPSIGGSGASSPGGIGGILAWVTRRAIGLALPLGALVTQGLTGVPVRLGTFERFLSGGVGVAVDDPSRLYHTFIRSGWLVESQRTGEGAINLTVLESLPLLGVAVALPLAARSTVEAGVARLRTDPARLGDAFVIGYVVVFVLLYVNRLPLHAQVTVRYLLPIVPGLVFAVARVPGVRRVVARDWRTLAWTYGALALIGTQLLFLGVRGLDLTVDEAVQLHALLGLAVGVAVGVWAIGDDLVGIDTRVGAVVIAVGLAVGTWFLLGTGLDYFVYGDYVLAIPRLVSDAISIV